MNDVEAGRRFLAKVIPDLGDRQRFIERMCGHARTIALIMLREANFPKALEQTHEEFVSRRAMAEYDLYKDVVSTLPRICPQFRDLHASDTLYVQLALSYRQQSGILIDEAVQRRAPQIIVRRDKDEFYEWDRATTEVQLKVEDDLRAGRIDDKRSFLVAFDAIATVSCLSLKHLFLFGIRLRDSETDLSTFELLRGLDFEPAAMASFRARMGEIVERLESAGDERFEKERREVLKELVGEKPPPLGALSAVIVSKPQPWPAFAARCREHLGDWLEDVEGKEPDKWNWLCEGCDYVLAIAGEALLNQSFRKAERLLRLLSASAECLRTLSNARTGEEARATPATCRFIAVPLGQCFAERKAASASWLFKRSERHREFEIGLAPFIHQDDFTSRSNERLADIFLSLANDAVGRRQQQCALEYFEGVSEIGGSLGAVAHHVRQAWTVAALWSSLEILFCKAKSRENRRAEVFAAVPRVLGQANCDASVISHVEDEIRKLPDLRNEVVHAGRAGINADVVSAQREAVSMIIGASLSNAK